MAASGRRGTLFKGSNVFLSRNLVAPETYDAVHDALKLNGAQVLMCCDPSRNSPNDFHVIASSQHEKFDDLRSKGCNLLGPFCVLACAKEQKALPNQGYTCCLAMDGVKVLTSGFEKDEKVKIERLVMSMGGVMHTKASSDVNFVIVKNVLASKYKWALNILKKPIVDVSWLYNCWNEHRLVPHEPHRIPPFTGLTICVTKLPADERKEIEKSIKQYGGLYSADLTRKCSHLISNTPEGDKYLVARRWGHIHIVTRKWFDHSIDKGACLDEGFYSVVVSSQPVRIPEKGESEITVSQPVMVPETGEPETTISHNLSSSSVSDARKCNNEELDATILETKVEMNFDSRVAEDSEIEDNDLYLSSCRIFLVGFRDKELHRLVIMIRKGGGSRHMLLSEKLTHIIIGAVSEVELKEVRRLSTWGVINIVKAAWLEECDRVKKEIPVATRHVAPELLLSRDGSNTMASSGGYGKEKGKDSSHIYQVADCEDSDNYAERTVVLEKRKAAIRPEIEINKRITRDSTACCSIRNQINAEHGEKNGSGLQNGFCFAEKQRRNSSSTFSNRTFCFASSFPIDRRAEIIEWVRQGGGVMVDDTGKSNADFIIERHGQSEALLVESLSTVVSSHWIRFCLEEGVMHDVQSHILFTPLRCSIPLPGFEGLRLCISQYEEKERMLLRNLCHTIGAKFTEKLTRKATHLLCKFMNGPKYEAACKWGIETITADWIIECIKQNVMVPFDSFRPKLVTAQDKEAGFCIVSQHPTQAARMVLGCGSSQLITQSQETGKYPSQIHEQTNASGERPGLLEKNNCEKFTNETLRGSRAFSNAVPDVADAIEDLLAQSNKIQDLKSSSPSDSNQTIFPSDNSILGQGHGASHSSFAAPMHWLNGKKGQGCVATSLPSHEGKRCVGNIFTETQDSQVVGYEEDLSGIQRIIDRVRSQSTATPQDK